MAAPQPETMNCPNCGAAYKVVRIETDADKQIACKSCGERLASREGRFALKYFLVRRPQGRRRGALTP